MAASDEHALLLQISYDLARLKAQGQKAHGQVDHDLSAIEKRAKHTAHELEETLSLKNVHVGSAMTLALGGLTEAATEEGARAFGILGGAVSALGPIGFGAAAGLGAVAAAVERGIKAGEWAESLEHAAGALGLTTTELQKFDFIATAGGIPVDRMRESMGGLARTIGLVEAGLARSMSVKAFTDGLKITPEQLRGWGDLEHQLPHILEAASKLDAEERAGIASRLKVDPEVLNALIELREDFGALTERAREYGIVMDEASVKKTAAAAKEMKIAAAIISGELNVAFADMAPLAASAAGKVVGATTAIGDLARGVRDALDPVRELLGLLGRIPGLSAGQVTGAILGAIPVVGPVSQGLGALMARGKQDRANAASDQALDEALDAAQGKGRGPKPTLLSPPKAKGGGKGETGASDLDTADKLLAEAEKGLAKGIDERALFERAALDAEEKRAEDKLSKDLKAAKKPADRADILKAQAETAEAFRLKRQLLAEQTDQANADQANAIAQLGLEGGRAMLEAEKGLGGTTRRRAEIERRIFDIDEQIAQAKLVEVIVSRTSSEAASARAAAELANLRATAPARRQAVDNQADQQIADQANAMAELGIKAQIDELDAQKGVFKTTEQRREIALKLFRLDEQLAELKLQEVLASKTASEAEKQRAQAALDSLRATAGAREQGVSQANPGNSWNAWLQDARASVKDVGEEFAQMKVDGIDAFNNSLFTSEGKLNSLGNIARSVARSFITDFEKMGVKTVESFVLGDGQGGGGIASLFGGGGAGAGAGGGVAGLLGGLFGGKASASKPDGSASNPFFTKAADAAGGGGAGGLLSSLFGGGGASGGGGGIGSIFSSLFGGGASGGGAGITSLGIPAFAGGGAFMVGGQGGVDRNIATMRLSRGERVSIETSQQQREGRRSAAGGNTFVFPNASIDGFKKTQRQLARQARMATQFGE